METREANQIPQRNSQRGEDSKADTASLRSAQRTPTGAGEVSHSCLAPPRSGVHWLVLPTCFQTRPPESQRQATANLPARGHPCSSPGKESPGPQVLTWQIPFLQKHPAELAVAVGSQGIQPLKSPSRCWGAGPHGSFSDDRGLEAGDQQWAGAWGLEPRSQSRLASLHSSMWPLGLGAGDPFYR